MAVVRWAPFDLASATFDDIVRRAFGEMPQFQRNDASWRPALNAYMQGDELHVELDAPGVDPEQDIEIEVAGGALTIRGERRLEAKDEGTNWFRREATYGVFERAIALPQGVDASSVRATYDAGILHVTVPMPARDATKVKVELGGTPTQKQLNE
jgi:HSP20 family protein